MNQLAMISESGESTASRNGFTHEDPLFGLKTSDLLKHLLSKKSGDSRVRVTQKFASLRSVFSSAKHGIMDEARSGSEVHNYRDNLHRFLSDESSQSQNDGLSEEELPVLPNEVLSSETMDFILAEAEKNLHIQSPPSSQVSQDSDSYEFTELLPAAGLAQCFEPGPSKEPTGDDKLKKGSISKCQKFNTAGSSSDSDSDIDNEMVLVPSGE